MTIKNPELRAADVAIRDLRHDREQAHRKVRYLDGEIAKALQRRMTLSMTARPTSGDKTCKKHKVRQTHTQQVLVECPSCLGYGHIDDENSHPTIDRRARTCLDCRGAGQVPSSI